MTDWTTCRVVRDRAGDLIKAVTRWRADGADASAGGASATERHGELGELS